MKPNTVSENYREGKSLKESPVGNEKKRERWLISSHSLPLAGKWCLLHYEPASLNLAEQNALVSPRPSLKAKIELLEAYLSQARPAC